MKQQFKRVTAMGLGLVLTGGLVSACNPASDSETAASAQHAAADSHAAPETDQAAPPPGVGGAVAGRLWCYYTSLCRSGSEWRS